VSSAWLSALPLLQGFQQRNDLERNLGAHIATFAADMGTPRTR